MHFFKYRIFCYWQSNEKNLINLLQMNVLLRYSEPLFESSAGSASDHHQFCRFLLSCRYQSLKKNCKTFLFKYAWFSRYCMLNFEPISSWVTRLNKFAAFRAFFQVSIKCPTLFSNYVLICSIFSQNWQKNKWADVAAWNWGYPKQLFLHFRATFWLYFSRMQSHPKAFFHGSY